MKKLLLILLPTVVIVCAGILIAVNVLNSNPQTPPNQSESGSELSSCEKNGHNFSLENTVITEPTCTQTGLEMRLCLECHKEIETVVPALGHKEKILPAVASTCTVDGKTEGKVCSRCGEVFVEQKIIPAGHLFTKWKVHSYPEYNKTGSAYSYCDKCGTEYITLDDKIPALSDENYDIKIEEDGKVYTCEVEGIQISFKILDFKFNKKDGYPWYVLTEYNGDRTSVTIPEKTPDGYEVKAIGDKVFFNNKTLTSVTIKDNIIEIGAYAFAGCSSLKNIDLANTSEFGESAFSGCEALKNLTINELYKGNNCLKGSFLTQLSIPSIRCISEIAIPETLKKLTILENDDVNLKALSELACAETLEELEIPHAKKITKLYENCSRLKKVVISEDIEFISPEAFATSSVLEKSTFNNGLYLGNDTNPCLVLVDYIKDGNSTKFNIKSGTRVIAVSKTFWSDYAEYFVPSSVKSILSLSEPQACNIKYDGSVTDWIKIESQFEFTPYGSDKEILSEDGIVTFPDGNTNKTITEITFDDNMVAYLNETLALGEKFRNLYLAGFENLNTIYYKGEQTDWDDTYVFSETIKHIYFYNENKGGFYEPEYLTLPIGKREIEDSTEIFETDIKALSSFAKIKGLIIDSRTKMIDKKAYVGFANYTLYYTGTEQQWENILIWDNRQIKSIKSMPQNLNIYFYSTTGQTLESYLNNPEKLWHYDENNNPKAWVLAGNTLDNKKFSYSSTVVEVSDEYWTALKTAEANGLLDSLLDNDAVQINMVKNSTNKTEYENKLKDFSKKTGTNMTVSFTNGQLTLSKAGETNVVFNYLEVNGSVYIKINNNYSKYMIINNSNNTLYEDSSDEHITIKHIWTLQ